MQICYSESFFEILFEDENQAENQEQPQEVQVATYPSPKARGPLSCHFLRRLPCASEQGRKSWSPAQAPRFASTAPLVLRASEQHASIDSHTHFWTLGKFPCSICKQNQTGEVLLTSLLFATTRSLNEGKYLYTYSFFWSLLNVFKSDCACCFLSGPSESAMVLGTHEICSFRPFELRKFLHHFRGFP